MSLTLDSEGLNNISQLKEAYKDKITTLRKTALVPGATAPLTPPPPPTPETVSSAPSLSPQAKPQPRPSTPQIPGRPTIKTLSSFLDVPKTLALPPPEIEKIWRIRHSASPSTLCATIPASTFAGMARAARRHPQFILPGLPRGTTPDEEEDATSTTHAETQSNGAHIHFLQWTFPSPDTATVIFTHLAEYKLRGEYAAAHTSLTHHMELAEEKGLVLAQGGVVEGRGVSVDEARWLVMCLQKFYGAAAADVVQEVGVAGELSRKRRRLLELFSAGDEAFRIEELVEQAERIG